MSVGPSVSHAAGAASFTAWKIVLIICLALGSAMSAGLTLGFMTMDLVQLKVLMNSSPHLNSAPSAASTNRADPTRKQRQYAKAVYPIRANGTLLLITLLMTNVGVNAAFSILLGDVTSGLVSFFLSTTILTLFGEILPQAVCTRWSLPICYWFIPMVYFLETILFPVAYPLAKLLDLLLGKELGVTYTRDQLNFLLRHHGTEAKVLGIDEIQLLEGSLRLHQTQAKSVMIPINQAFGLHTGQLLTKSTLAHIIGSGYSRFPVFKTPTRECISCFLHLKDLALINPQDHISVEAATALMGRYMITASQSITLLKLLSVFSGGRSRMCLLMDEGRHAPSGIITMEDIYQQIIQNHNQDEFSPVLPDLIETDSCPSNEPCDDVPRWGLKVCTKGLVPLEPSMSYVTTKILPKRVWEDDMTIRTARVRLLADLATIQELSWDQAYVIHIYLTRRFTGDPMWHPNPSRDEIAIRLLQQAPLIFHSEGTMVRCAGPYMTLVLKGYLHSDGHIFGSWSLIRQEAPSQESILSLSTDACDSSQASEVKGVNEGYLIAGVSGCTTLHLDDNILHNAYHVTKQEGTIL
eukprot:Blabericola_migrator_1__6503@NODE_327_length_9735_cov_125_899772_g264_i0_p2_GENE_NODE_327_length_9735_cov_125_899772_g264_i0NODE_327_length_9735_cov_125_899772_g264_i0_p2_ORF_typecomplete_len579_score37_48DUF21/PF01595_20/9_2e38CBS/PF00571_28/1_8e04CBS/PF00571_28/0_15DUF1195/PF06708_11/1_7DUF1195/PF06708_11/1_8e02_NODE_327_length_9735_cov_125_899772_g264_i078139549